MPVGQESEASMDVLLQEWPGGHEVQEVEPTGDYVPEGHDTGIPVVSKQ